MVEDFELFDQSATAGRTSELFVRLRFWDGSLLQVKEALAVRALAIVKVRYNYHYQRADGTQIFRYDNAPHYPDLPGFPEHKYLFKNNLAYCGRGVHLMPHSKREVIS